MAEDKSSPKKETSPTAAEGSPADTPPVSGPDAGAEKKGKAPKRTSEKDHAGGKPAADAGASTAGTAVGDKKPVELVGGVARQPSAEDLLKEELGTVKVRKAKGSKNVTSGFANVLASFNNTIVSITDHKGQVIAWSSAGKCNFRGSRKSTAYAAQIVAQDAARNAMAHGLKDIVIRVSGPGLGRDSAIRALQAIGLEVTSIVDVTPIPHNGCRPRKRRRV